MNGWLGLPIIASAHGAEIDHVIDIVHVLMFALGIGWGLFFLYTLVRFRRKRNPQADYKGVRSHASSYLEVAVAIFEAVLLIGFSIPIWSKRVNAFPPESSSLVVRVVAEQFAWNVHYPGKDGVFGATKPELVNVQSNPLGLDSTDPNGKDDFSTTNQLNIEINKPVIVRLSSKDVIHSFGIPLMRVKHDIIPGMTIPLWFEPKEPGQYEIVCSQLCGLGHYRMRGFVTVQSPEEFAQWSAEQEKAKAASVSGGGGDDFWQ